jgi:hypothetical protein
MLEIMPSLKEVTIVLDIEDMPFHSSHPRNMRTPGKRMEFFEKHPRSERNGWGGRGQLPAVVEPKRAEGELLRVEERLRGWDVENVRVVFGWRHVEGVLTRDELKIRRRYQDALFFLRR